MEQNCPKCKAKNKPKKSFEHPESYFTHHHYDCKECGEKWGANEELPRPAISNPNQDLIDRIKGGDEKAIEEGLLKVLGD